jgi:hypothetical protein
MKYLSQLASVVRKKQGTEVKRAVVAVEIWSAHRNLYESRQSSGKLERVWGEEDRVATHRNLAALILKPILALKGCEDQYRIGRESKCLRH